MATTWTSVNDIPNTSWSDVVDDPAFINQRQLWHIKPFSGDQKLSLIGSGSLAVEELFVKVDELDIIPEDIQDTHNDWTISDDVGLV